MAAKSNKIIKRLGFIFLILITLLSVAGFIGIRKFNNAFFKERPNVLTYTTEPAPINFEWGNDSMGNHFEQKTALLIPAKIEDFKLKAYFQFDTGSPYSYIYENDLESLRKMGLTINEVIIDDKRFVEHLELVLGGNLTQISNIEIYKKHGNHFTPADSLKTFSMGTIGSDFLHDAVTSIDFKKKQIQFYSRRPDWMLSLEGFKPFSFEGRRLMLPATIEGRKLEFLYDTGCSAFGLITTKDRYEQFSDKNSKEINYDANSWGDAIPIRHKLTSSKIAFGNTPLSLKRVSFVDMYAAVQPLISPFTRIGGFLGNLPFLESTVIFDTQKEEFIVLQE